MTSPQLENGHTRIANEILEQVARHDFTGGELRILLVLWRQTYGYGKKSDAISIGQFEKKTGISRRGVFKCLNSLQGRNVIQKIATHSGPNEWRYNKDSDAWGVNHSSLVNQSARVNHSSLVGGEPQCTKGGEPECTHKRNKKRKKNTAPEVVDPRFQPLKKFFHEQYEKIRGVKLDTDGSDYLALNRLLKRNKTNLEDLKRATTRFLESDNPFHAMQGHPLRHWANNINPFLAGQKSKTSDLKVFN